MADEPLTIEKLMEAMRTLGSAPPRPFEFMPNFESEPRPIFRHWPSAIRVFRSPHVPTKVSKPLPRPRTDDMREMVETLQSVGWCSETHMVPGACLLSDGQHGMSLICGET